MFRFLLLCFACILSSIYCPAQAPSLPFIKISHLGTQGRPIIDLYLTTQMPALNPEAGLDGRYRFQSVCLLSEAEFSPLLRYIESYITQHKEDKRDKEYGTFELTLGAGQPAKTVVYTRTKSLAFLNGALQVLQKQAAGPDKSEALRRLEGTTRRLSAGK
ncbi:MAG: hypothetical protein ACRYG7_35465 [Janthinobacterium lividum]